MDDTTLKAIIGVVGVIGGTLIGGFVAAYNARQKLKEIEVNHSHQLHENYLNNAREYGICICTIINGCYKSFS